MKRLLFISSLLALGAVGAMAGTVVVEGFENSVDPGGWQEVSTVGTQTINAVNNPLPVPTYVATNVTEGVQAGQFTHTWNVPPIHTGITNFLVSGGPTTFWALRLNVATPANFGLIPHTSVLKADIYNNTNDPVQFCFTLRDNSGAGSLENGPFVTLTPNASTTYTWDLTSTAPTGLFGGDGVLDGSSSHLRGGYWYSATSPTSTNWDCTIDNIRLDTAQTDFTPPSPPVILSAVQGAASDEIVVRWQANAEPDLVSYRVYLADDDRFGALIQNRFAWPTTATATVLAGTNQVTLTNVTPEANFYVRVTAVDNATPSANESLSREALGVRTGTGTVRDLVVLDNEAIDPSNAQYPIQGYSHNVVYNGQALAANGRFFDSCTATAVSTDVVSLTSISASEFVVWSNGVDGGSGFGGVSIDDANITRLTTFLNAGGKLFTSGRSLGEDLDDVANVAGQAFFNGELFADLVVPQTSANEIDLSGPFSSVSVMYMGVNSFDYGAGSTNSSESLNALIPASSAGVYNPAPGSGGSAIIYNANQTVIMGVDFEVLRPFPDSSGTFADAAAARATFMGDVIDYFFPSPTTSVENYESYR